MTGRQKVEQVPAPSRPAAQNARSWLLFVHQLPSSPSNLRVRTWRRLQQLGALPIKQAVYVLPDSPGAREDFEWLTTEVKASGGDASVFAANHLDAWSDDALMDEFRRTGQEAYAALAADVAKVLKRASTVRRPPGTRAPAMRRLMEVFQERLAGIESIDFFGSAGRDRVTTLLTQFKERTLPTAHPSASSTTVSRTDAANYQDRLWVTRPRPGVDRMASAWLIRRFIDPGDASLCGELNAVPEDAIPFDMFGVEFSHQGEGCTFETLCGVFGIAEPAVERIATIVHDLDLKDGKFSAPEGSTVSTLIDGLQLAHADDEELLTHGMALFDVLYPGFERSARSTGPRPVAGPRQRVTPNSGKSKRRPRAR